jgi:hypothetical protein
MLNDLKIGAKAEDQVKTFFESKGFSCSKNSNKTERSFYDILVTSGPAIDLLPIRLEVKHDVMAQKTGNVAIEFYNPKSCKHSGIGITKADLWCHVMQGEIWAASVQSLKKFIDENPPDRTITTGGDDNSSMYLYKKDTILGPLMLKLNDLDDLEFIAWLSGQLADK